MGKFHRTRSDKEPDLIIKGGVVLTMVQGEEPLEDAWIAVKDGIISDVVKKGGSPPPAGIETIQGADGIVMPGLVNAHNHAAMTLFRGFADDLPLKTWLFEKIFPLESGFLNVETVYWGAALGCLEMIASGTTCFADGYFFQDATVRAVHDSGLRGLIAQGVIDLPAPGVENPEKNLQTAREFVEKWIGFSDLIRPGLFCHSPLTCSGETLRNAAELARKFDLPLQLHLSETREEVDEIVKRQGKRPVEYLDDLGLLDQNLLAAHAVHLERAEVLRLREKGAKVVHAPESNMKLSSGIAPVAEMIKAGLTVALGTDGCASNNNLDLFREMDTAAKLSKVFTLDPVSLSAKEALRMATRGGAAAVGLEQEIGTIEVGKRADIIVVDLRGPHLSPLYDPFSSLVYSARGSDVKDVVVNGRPLLKEREFTTLDGPRILAKVREIGESIARGSH